LSYHIYIIAAQQRRGSY